MRITPLDVRKQEFRKAVRGFDCDEVRAFLTTLADEYETVLVDNKQIRERIMEQDDKIAEYKTMERTLRDTLMTAEKLMQETRETANREGEVIILAAHQKAKNILEECRLRTEELRREIVGLRKEKETYLARFKGLAEAQIAFIESHKNDFADLDKRLVDLMDSVVDGAISSETEVRLQAPARTEPAPPPAPAYPAAAASRQDVPAEAPATPPAPVHDEVDMWRDYNPGAGKTLETPADTHQAEPVASPEAATSEPEVLVNEVIAETSENTVPAGAETPEGAGGTRETTSSGVSSASVDMAAMGIPVPAVPAVGPGEGQDETDAITEAISATLSEEPRPETVPNG